MKRNDKAGKRRWRRGQGADWGVGAGPGAPESWVSSLEASDSVLKLVGKYTKRHIDPFGYFKCLKCGKWIQWH